jgi:hypothetical protein
MNAENLVILPYVQKALAYYAFYLGAESIGVQVGDQGIQQSSSQNSQPAPRWKIRDLKTSYLQKADMHAEVLLQYLEENAGPAKYASWFADIDANTAMSGLIVHGVRVASKYIDIGNSRRVFLKLKKRIKQIEALYIKKIICGDQYEELVTQLQTDSLTAANESLIEVLEPVISKKALYETLPSIRISVTPEGIHLISINDSTTQQMSASDKEINDLKCSLKEGDLGYLQDEETLKKFIADNIADYPMISASPCYSTEPLNSRYVADNDPCNKHFSV